MGVSTGRIHVGTGYSGPVKGKIILLSSKSPNEDFSNYDHIVEGSIEIKSGVIEIIPCTANEPELTINVDPGCYRLRVYSSCLNTIVDDEGDDFYTLEIWKESFSERKVLKMSQ